MAGRRRRRAASASRAWRRATRRAWRARNAVADAAGVALAVFPSAAPGTHPTVVTLAPTDDWQAALASSVLMAPPIHAPVLLSGPGSLPAPTADALKLLAPTGSGSLSGAQVVLVGDVPKPSGLRAATIGGSDPYSVAAGIDRFVTAADGGHASPDVVIASSSDPAYAMPAAGWAAESGDPILFVTPNSIPKPTIQALQAHQKPKIYVLGPPSVVSNAVLKQLGRYGTVKRISGNDPASNSVAFAGLPRPAVQVRPGVRSRARQLRLGDARPGSRVHAAERVAAVDRRRLGSTLGERRLWSPAGRRRWLYPL